MKVSAYRVSSIVRKNVPVTSIPHQPERGQNFLHVSPDQVMWKMAYPLELPAGKCVAFSSLNPEYDRLLADRLFDEIYEHPEGATAFITPLSGKMRDQLQELRRQLDRSLQLLHAEQPNASPILEGVSAAPIASAAFHQEKTSGGTGSIPTATDKNPALKEAQDIPLWENVLRRESQMSDQRKKKEKALNFGDHKQAPEKYGEARPGDTFPPMSSEVLLLAAGACLATGFALGFLLHGERQEQDNEKKKEPSPHDERRGCI